MPQIDTLPTSPLAEDVPQAEASVSVLLEAPSRRGSYRIDWATSIPFLSVHLAALAGAFFFPITWKGVALCVGMYYLRMFGITAGYHRYFSHRSYKTGRVFQYVLAWLGAISVQKGALWWAAHHRDHHRYSDQPEDVHSPVQRGFWWSHVSWILAYRYQDTDYSRIRDFAKYPELVWLNKHFLVPVFAFAVLMVSIAGFDGLYWGFFVSTVLLWHGTFTVNSLAHVWGRRRYRTSDESRNNFWIALITLGEGWHNNHHHYMSSTRQGFFWWEIDGSYYILKALSKVGLVWDLREPPPQIYSP